MEDIIKSIKAFLYDRSVSPLFGSYLTSLLFVNYDFFIILFSNVKPQVKISLIEQLLNKDVLLFNSVIVQEKYYTFIFLPCLLSLFYIFAYPILAKPVFEYSLRKQHELRNIKNNIENSRLLTAEESRELLIQFSQITEKQRTESENYRNEIQALNHKIAELQSKSASVENIDELESDSPLDEKDDFSSLYEDALTNINNLSDGEYIIDELLPNDSSSDDYGKTEINNALISNISARKINNFRAYPKTGKIIKSDKFEPILLSDEEIVLKCFTTVDEKTSLYDIAKSTSLHISKIKNILTMLTQKSYITYDSYATKGSDNAIYYLHEKGRKYLTENGYFE